MRLICSYKKDCLIFMAEDLEKRLANHEKRISGYYGILQRKW